MTRSWWFPETSLFAFISCPQPLWNHLEGYLTPPPRGKVFLATLKAIGTMLPNADETRFLSASPHLPKSKGSGGISERHTEGDLRFQTSTSIWSPFARPWLLLALLAWFDFLSQGNEILNGCSLVFESTFLAIRCSSSSSSSLDKF